MEIKKTGLWFGRQAVRMCLMVLLVSILAFGLLAVSPIDPLQTNVGQTALGAMSPEQIAKLKSYWGTDLPPVERYLNWLKDFLHGNMGTSLLYRRPVAEVIGQKVMNSIWLLFTAWLFSGILGFFLGVLAGKKRGGIMDRIVTGYSLFVASTPAFWVAMVLLLVFAVKLHWFPIGFSVPIGMDAGQISIADRIRHAILPAAALSITGISSIALHTREKLIEVMESDYVLFARARGESDWSILRRHGFRNILLPAMTLQFASVSEIIGGSVLVSGIGPGGCDGRTWKRCAASSGDHGGYSGDRRGGKPCGECSLRRDRPADQRGGEALMKKNRRMQSFALLIMAAVLLAVIAVLGSFWQEAAIRTDFTRKNLAPCIQYPFGTDWMGRDMFVRTVAGLSLSIRIGLLTAAVSAVMAFVLGLSAAVFGKFVDSTVRLLIDIVMGIPHMLLLILISFACGRGFWGVVCGIAFTHWASLARLIRGEVLQLKQSQYVKIAEKLGKGKFYIAFSHMAPNLVPQFITGLVLMFPHAILHEASITFLGFGLSSESPAIGVILSESMKYLAMGKWWLALFPGLFLVGTVLLFHYIGQELCRLLDPGSVHE